MKKRIAMLVALAMSFSLLASCGNENAGGDANKDQDSGTSGTSPVVTLKFGNAGNDQSVYQKASLKFEELVEEATDGAVQVEVYCNAQLGAERDMVESMQLGSLDMGIVATAVLGSFVPEYALLDAPFMFSDADHAYRVTESEIGDMLAEKTLETQNVRVLTFFQNGFRHIFSTKPIREIDDFKGLKLRTMENAVHQAAFSKLGALPTSMSFSELFTALQQKTVDAAENSLETIYSQKFYEAAPYVTLSGHSFGFSGVCMSEKTWEKIPEEYREVILNAAHETAEYEKQLLAEATDSAIQDLEDAGTEIIEIDTDAIYDICSTVYSDFSDILPEESVEYINSLK